MRIKVKHIISEGDLTVGKIYNVIDKYDKGYLITNDDGVAVKIHRDNCEIVKGSKVKVNLKNFPSGVYEVVDSYEHGVIVMVGDECNLLHYLWYDIINGHPHAELIMKYAEIAQYDAEPWKHFEADFGCGWVDVAVLTFHEAAKYRLKPRTININGFEVPEPLRSVPTLGSDYFIVRVSEIGECSWDGISYEYEWLKAGIIHLTREAAEKHLEALLSFTKE